MQIFIMIFQIRRQTLKKLIACLVLFLWESYSSVSINRFAGEHDKREKYKYLSSQATNEIIK